MNKPNLFVAGVARCGTTSLHNYLDQHPDIYMSTIKEPRYFAGECFTHPYYKNLTTKNTVKTLEEYLGLFSGVTSEKVLGEASPVYFYHPDAPARIKEFNPDAKIIVMVRNPILRCLSNYMLRVNMGKEPLTLSEAVDDELKDMNSVWDGQRHYIRMGFFGRSYQNLLKHFDKKQVRIFFNEDMNKNPVEFMRSVYEFVGVDPSFQPQTDFVFQKSGIPKSTFLHKITKLKAIKGFAKALMPSSAREKMKMTVREKLYDRPEVDAATKQKLIDIYKDDVKLFESLVGRDLKHWLK